jgi:hypothetical protein
VDLDDVADELYGLPPDEFMPARSTYEQQARADGDRALAAEIKALGKPSTAAWVANVLVRHHREEIQNLVELGGLLREAQENLEGDQLRTLDVQRRQLVSALTRQSRALANQLGHPVSGAVGQQVEETLRAAMSDPEAGEALLEGRLTSPMSYSGLGTIARPTLRVVHPPREKPPVRKPTTDKARSNAEARREEARRAAEERLRRELDEARRAVEEAEAAADEAAAAADDERRTAADLAARHDQLVDHVEELTLELSRARDEATRLGSERSRAERRREAAERRSAEADRARDRARATLDRLDATTPG